LPVGLVVLDSLALRLPYPLVSDKDVASAIGHQFRREEAVMQERIEAMEKIATEHGFLSYPVLGNLLRVWTLSEHRQVEEGIAYMQQCLSVMRATGTKLLLPYWLLLLAAAHARSGQAEKGLEIVTESLTLMNGSEECLWEAELWRLKGELLLAQAREQATGNGQQK
jgi:predicted ATPase